MHNFSIKKDNKSIGENIMLPINVNMCYIKNPPAIMASVPQNESVANMMRGDSKDTYVFCAPETL